jgi:hypothetical protein
VVWPCQDTNPVAQRYWLRNHGTHWHLRLDAAVSSTEIADKRTARGADRRKLRVASVGVFVQLVLTCDTKWWSIRNNERLQSVRDRVRAACAYTLTWIFHWRSLTLSAMHCRSHTSLNMNVDRQLLKGAGERPCAYTLATARVPRPGSSYSKLNQDDQAACYS